MEERTLKSRSLVSVLIVRLRLRYKMAYEPTEAEVKAYQKFKSEVSTRLKQIRIEQGKSQEDACGAQISIRAYYRIEKGITGPNLKTIFYICNNLGIAPEELFSGGKLDGH